MAVRARDQTRVPARYSLIARLSSLSLPSLEVSLGRTPHHISRSTPALHERPRAEQASEKVSPPTNLPALSCLASGLATITSFRHGHVFMVGRLEMCNSHKKFHHSRRLAPEQSCALFGDAAMDSDVALQVDTPGKVGKWEI